MIKLSIMDNFDTEDVMEYRIEHDSLGEVLVPKDRFWGAQTQRSFENFKIGGELMPSEVIKALAIIKLASARANMKLRPGKMTEEKLAAIEKAAKRIIAGELNSEFPLVVWQTGSGTQTNMNVNEVIANVANIEASRKLLHPNDDVNMSQSSNDTFPSAMHIAGYIEITEKLIPALDGLISEFERLEAENRNIVKCGRTHLQDATPITFGQEISGWRASLIASKRMIVKAADELLPLALGGTADRKSVV